MELRIKELRKARGWTVDHLADLVGLSKSYVSEIENGKKQANQVRIAKFAKVFNVTVLELLDEGTVGPEEMQLLRKFAQLSDKSRQALLAVADSMED